MILNRNNIFYATHPWSCDCNSCKYQIPVTLGKNEINCIQCGYSKCQCFSNEKEKAIAVEITFNEVQMDSIKQSITMIIAKEVKKTMDILKNTDELAKLCHNRQVTTEEIETMIKFIRSQSIDYKTPNLNGNVYTKESLNKCGKNEYVHIKGEPNEMAFLNQRVPMETRLGELSKYPEENIFLKDKFVEDRRIFENGPLTKIFTTETLNNLIEETSEPVCKCNIMAGCTCGAITPYKGGLQ